MIASSAPVRKNWAETDRIRLITSFWKQIKTTSKDVVFIDPNNYVSLRRCWNGEIISNSTMDPMMATIKLRTLNPVTPA